MPENPRILETPAPRDLPTYTLFLEEQALETSFQVLSIRVQKEANRIPTAYLTLKDGDPASGNFPASNDNRFVPGKKLEIRAGYHKTEKTIFKGILVRQGIEAQSTGTTRLNLLAKDVWVKTTLVPKRRYFTEKKDSEAAEEIAQTYRGLEIDAEDTRLSARRTDSV